jgi:predicted helicase
MNKAAIRNIQRAVADYESRLRLLLDERESAKKPFLAYLAGLNNLADRPIALDEAIDFLIQFQALRPTTEMIFFDYPYYGRQKCHSLASEISAVYEAQGFSLLNGSYSGMASYSEYLGTVIREKADALKFSANPREDRQKLLMDSISDIFGLLYPKEKDRHGIVFTPIEVADFIIRSVDAACIKEYGKSISEPGLEILDPFAGTGIFPARVIHLGYLSGEHGLLKYREELKSNEITILSYWIGTINIEAAFWKETEGRYGYEPFRGARLADTFQDFENEMNKSGLLEEICL